MFNRFAYVHIASLRMFLLQAIQLLIFEPMCLNLCIFSALSIGILYLFFGVFPLVFMTHHNFTGMGLKRAMPSKFLEPLIPTARNPGLIMAFTIHLLKILTCRTSWP